MLDVRERFESRLGEVEDYLELLSRLDDEARRTPKLPSIGGVTLTRTQQGILYSVVYLQLYNLMEATVTWCLEAVSQAAAEGGRWRPSDLCEGLRREWIRQTARTHTELIPEHRLAWATAMCDHLIQSLPVRRLEIECGSGNWDEDQVRAATQRIGLELRLSKEVFSLIKQPVRDEKGPLVLVKDYRNRLAHGSISFAECGEGVSTEDLTRVKDRTAGYLREVVRAFELYIADHRYLSPDARPQPPEAA